MFLHFYHKIKIIITNAKNIKVSEKIPRNHKKQFHALLGLICREHQHTRTTQGLYMQYIIGISVTMRALEPGQRFQRSFWMQRWRLRRQQRRQRLQSYQNI